MSRYVRVVEISRGYVHESIWLQAALGCKQPFDMQAQMTAILDAAACALATLCAEWEQLEKICT